MLKLVSINIQGADGTMHHTRVRDFVTKENPDILCLQELRENEVHDFAERYGHHHAFAPMGTIENPHKEKAMVGIGLFSRFPLTDIRTEYYFSAKDFTWGHVVNRVLLTGSVSCDGTDYTIGTTHFTFTGKGEPDDRQRRDLSVFLDLLSGYRDILFCGDFNAPRGMETFDTIAMKYRDHIPSKYDTSLDPNFHKTKGAVRFMVDGLFSTPEYQTENVRLQFGVSDHAAIVATIQKKGS